jgi:hypothetical protein
MRSSTIICIRWKITGRIELFSNLGKLYSNYSDSVIGVSRYTLDRRNLFEGYQNDTVEIYKMRLS